MEAYLDNAATTRVSAAVMEKMNQVFLADFGNPSSMHKKGMDAEQYIKEFGNLAKTGNTMILPADLANVAGFVRSTLDVIKTNEPKND